MWSWFLLSHFPDSGQVVFVDENTRWEDNHTPVEAGWNSGLDLQTSDTQASPDSVTLDPCIYETFVKPHQCMTQSQTAERCSSIMKLLLLPTQEFEVCGSFASAGCTCSTRNKSLSASCGVAWPQVSAFFSSQVVQPVCIGRLGFADAPSGVPPDGARIQEGLRERSFCIDIYMTWMPQWGHSAPILLIATLFGFWAESRMWRTQKGLESMWTMCHTTTTSTSGGTLLCGSEPVEHLKLKPNIFCFQGQPLWLWKQWEGRGSA